MSQRSMFFDAVSGDRSYDAASFAALFRAVVQRDGVVYGYGGALAVTAPGGMNVSVNTGAAFVLGRMFEVYSASETLTIAAADPTYPRIDRVTVKLDLSTGVRSVSLAVKQGVAQASPVAPALQRDTVVWELSLAQIYVGAGVTSIVAGNITDERADETVCGYVATSLIKTASLADGAATSRKVKPSTFKVTISSNFTTTTYGSYVDVAGLSFTVTPDVASVLYVSAFATMLSSVNNSLYLKISIMDGATEVDDFRQGGYGDSNTNVALTISGISVPLTAGKTYTVKCQVSQLSSGTLTFNSGYFSRLSAVLFAT